MRKNYLMKGKWEENGEWVVGYYQEYPEEKACIRNEFNVCFKIIPETLCQNFRSQDKEIWQSDIVRTERGYVGIVQLGEYNIYDYGFYIEWIKGDEALRKELLYWIPEIEVIGNYFDNPELISNKQKGLKMFESKNSYINSKMTIRLNTIENVNDFAKICSKYENCNIDVKQGRQIIDGKSILGIYSLNLLKNLEVSIDTTNKCMKKDFYEEIKKWEVIIEMPDFNK